MLTEVADGVFVRQSAFCRSNAVVVASSTGALLIDPGVDGDDLSELADDLASLGMAVTAGFSTHPHWDHLLWHTRFGEVPRYATGTCAAAAIARRPRLREMTSRLAPNAPLDLVGLVTPLPANSSRVPWPGPKVRLIEHRAHAPGHAALIVEDSGVLVAGDMLSDVEIPLLDPEATDPCGDYTAALDLLTTTCDDRVAVVIPGHGEIARGTEIRTRLEADTLYVRALHHGVPDDRRVGPDATYGTDWLPEAHARNVELGAG
jgi:glyoxylase-like metal-dependent hydrolase (beta-lactamase superfamily II)